MKLRDYQKDCVKSIQETFKDNESQIVQLPTGAGKTVILWHYIKKSNKRALIVAPTRELVEQIFETGLEVVGFEKVGFKSSSHVSFADQKKNLVMTTNSLTWLLKSPPCWLKNFNLLIFDEAHRSYAKKAKEAIDYFKEIDAKCLGLTATPERLDGKSLLDIYDKLSYKKTLIELINEGYLTDLKCYKVKTRHKVKDLRYHAGDIAPSVLKQLDVDSRNAIILDVYQKNCKEKKTLVFCLNVNHAKIMAKDFKDFNIKAEAIYGELSKSKRSEILRKFRSGEIDVLCNCQLLTEGFDEPSIEAIILARPTKSKTLYCQMVGRGVRPYKDKKHCLIYDLSDEIHNICNFNVLGGIPPESNIDWESGENFTDVIENHKKNFLSLNDVTYNCEKFTLYEERGIEKIPAVKSQRELLDYYDIPYDFDINMEEAAYLIFKTMLLRKHNICSQNYWDNFRIDPHIDDTYVEKIVPEYMEV
jgi:superfamily II DNA or RNA helicase